MSVAEIELAGLVEIALTDETCILLMNWPDDLELVVCRLELLVVLIWFTSLETTSLGIRYPLHTSEPRQLLGSFMKPPKPFTLEKAIANMRL